ncbi:MAG: right-handed parallel beta-helix repeat-containing protein [Aphanocapsa sp. GSE-SYN-MK-11-07L]|nr:right-handed parallel beta-helix repeat-containing protein [Aphanocapsa sp. GSE-SYN-MK-11-07L]
MPIYINPESAEAADTNLGTKAFPLKTIAAGLKQAVRQRNKGVAAQILIYPGVYRESLSLDLKGSLTDAAISLEALPTTESAAVMITGSEVWDDWSQSKNTAIYTHPWRSDWGLAGNPWQEYEIDLAPIVQRGEMIFVNGQLMQQVLSLAELTAGRFYISEPENLVYLYPSDRLDLEQANIEVATQTGIFRLTNASNVSIKGITFKHAAGAFSAAASVSNSTNFLIENCQFVWNNWAGLIISNSQNITVQNSQAEHNGLKGITANHITNLNLTDVSSSYNNWRGAWGEFYDWDAGEKYFYIHGGRFENYRAIANLSAGLWLDTDNQDIVIDHAFLASNAVTGLFLEAGPGPITVKNSIICNNYQVADNYLQTPGLFAWSAANVTVENNLIFGNEFAQVGIRDLYPRQVEGKPNQTGTLVSQDWQFRNNVIINTSPDQKLLVTLKAKPFLDSLQSDNNMWSVAAKPALDQAVTPFQIEQSQLTFQQWQSDWGKDQNSIFLDAQTQPFLPTPPAD